MKKLIQSVLFLAMTMVTGSLPAFAGDVCFIGNSEVNTRAMMEGPGSNMEPIEITAFMAAGPQCRDLEPYLATFRATKYAFYVTSAALCLGGPLTATATMVLFGAGFAMESLNFLVENVPCEPELPKAEIDRRVELKVCEALKANGFDCKKVPK